MSYILKLASNLAVFCIVAAFVLGGVFEITKNRIALEQKRVMEEALSEVIPGAKQILSVNTTDGKQYYRGIAGDDTTASPVGYAVKVYGKGYSSTIIALVGVDTAGEISGIKILFQQETPGLGTKVQEIRYGETTPWFQQQFIKKSGMSVSVDKDGGQITSITGATVTSRAITNAVKNQILWLKEQGVISSVSAALLDNRILQSVSLETYK